MKTKEDSLIKILFVCMGNICRSPTAEGIFRYLVEQEELGDSVYIDSAGTGAWHVGSSPDKRAQEIARLRGIDLGSIRARQVSADDFNAFDYILAMDQSNLDHLNIMCPPAFKGKIRLFLDFFPDAPHREVPDPYYGGVRGFETVFDLIEETSRRLLENIRAQHLTK